LRDCITSPDIIKIFPDAGKQALAWHRAVILPETHLQSGVELLHQSMVLVERPLAVTAYAEED